MPSYEGMLVVRDTTVAHGGRASIRSEGGREGMVQTRAGVCQVFSNRALAGRRLRLSGFIRCDSLESSAFARLYCHTLKGMVQSPPATILGGTTDWSEVSAEMDVPPGTYEVWAWLVYNAPANGRVYFDDGRLEVVGPATASGTKPGP
jgi:hypothetical protein